MNQPVDHQCVAQKGRMSLALAAFSLWIAFSIFSNRCLFADGAHEFIRVLAAQDFVVLMHSRQFAFFIYEFPLVLAIKLGVTDLSWLRFAFSLGCFLPCPLALWLCGRISPENFWLAALGCAAGYLNTAVMAVEEHIVATALFWPALFVLLFARQLKPAWVLVLLLMAVGLLFNYESQIFLCVPLAMLSAWRAIAAKRAKAGPAWIFFTVIAGLFSVSIINGIGSILYPELPVNLAGFKKNTLAVFYHPGWTAIWTILWCGLMATACGSEKAWQCISGKTGKLFLITVILIWGMWPLLAQLTVDIGVEYDNRVLNLLVPMAILPVALLAAFKPVLLANFRSRLVILTAGLLLAQSLWQTSATAIWYRDALTMRTILATEQGIVPLHNTVLAADGMLGRDLHDNFVGGRFDWSWPSLSIALAPQKQINCLICSEEFMDPVIRQRCWQPFDPFRPETLPHLEHYGIHFTNYIAALQKQTGIEATSPP